VAAAAVVAATAVAASLPGSRAVVASTPVHKTRCRRISIMAALAIVFVGMLQFIRIVVR
jgi:hypothetical protein